VLPIQESEAFLSVEAEDSSHKNVRDKRTIGFLRQLFPNLSQVKFNTLYILTYTPTWQPITNSITFTLLCAINRFDNYFIVNQC